MMGQLGVKYDTVWYDYTPWRGDNNYEEEKKYKRKVCMRTTIGHKLVRNNNAIIPKMTVCCARTWKETGKLSSWLHKSRLDVWGGDVLRLLKVIAKTGNKPHWEFRLSWVFTSAKESRKKKNWRNTKIKGGAPINGSSKGEKERRHVRINQHRMEGGKDRESAVVHSLIVTTILTFLF